MPSLDFCYVFGLARRCLLALLPLRPCSPFLPPTMVFFLQGALCAGRCSRSWMIITWILSSPSPRHRWDSMGVSGHGGLHGRPWLAGHQGLWSLGTAILLPDTDYLKWLFPTSMRSNLYRICYSPWGQEFSICNYWHGELGVRNWGPHREGILGVQAVAVTPTVMTVTSCS